MLVAEERRRETGILMLHMAKSIRAGGGAPVIVTFSQRRVSAVISECMEDAAQTTSKKY